MRGLDLVMASYVDVLEHMPEEVEILGVRMSRDWITVPNGRHVEAVSVEVHAKGWKAAQTIAEALRLGEVEGRMGESHYSGRQQWRQWRGWVDNGSLVGPVSVEVEAAEHIDLADFDPSEFAPFVPAAPVAA